MSILLALFLWTVVVPLALLIALILFIVGLSTDAEQKRVRAQRFRLALWFALAPIGAAILVSVIAAISAVVTAGAV